MHWSQENTLAPQQSERLSPNDIVIFQPEFIEFGGEERVILSLCRELQAQGRPHAVVCYWDHIQLAQYAEWPLKVVALSPKKNPVSKVLSLRRCLQEIARNGGPVPVLFNIQSAYHAGLAVNAPYHLRIPDTYSLLAFVPEGSKPNHLSIASAIKTKVSLILRHIATRRGIRRAVKFATNTVALRNEMQQLYGRSSEVIYLGGLGSPLQQVPLRFTAPVELLTVSRLQSSKRIDWILQALAEVNNSGIAYPTWRLHIAGTGPDGDMLKRLAMDLGLGEQVVFHGFVSDAELQSLYARSHIFLMPAKQGYGLPAIEALYQKMGLVVSDESGVVEILGNTNWVAIARGGKPGFGAAVANMLRRVAQPGFFEQPLPDLPIEKSWAIKLIGHLQW